MEERGGDPHELVEEGDPHQRVEEGDPHQRVEEGDPHQRVEEGDPHQRVEEGDPHELEMGICSSPAWSLLDCEDVGEWIERENCSLL